MTSLSDDRQTDIIEAFNSTYRYLDYLLNIDNLHFEGMVNQVHPHVLRLNKADIYATEDFFGFKSLCFQRLFPPKFIKHAMTLMQWF